jgi:hypothetical protein
MSDLYEFGDDWDKTWSLLPLGAAVTLRRSRGTSENNFHHTYAVTIALAEDLPIVSATSTKNFLDALQQTIPTARHQAGLPAVGEPSPDIRSAVGKTWFTLMHRAAAALRSGNTKT